MRTLLIAAMVATLASCATTPTPTESAIAVPSDRVLMPKLIAPRAGAGSLLLKRDRGFYGGACLFQVYLDGRPFAKMLAGEKIQIYLAPGEYIIGASGVGLCGAADVETSLALAAGQTRTYRLGMSGNGEIKLHPSAF